MGIKCNEPNRKCRDRTINSYIDNSNYNNTNINNDNFTNNSFNAVSKPNQLYNQFHEKSKQNNSKPLYNNNIINGKINHAISNEYNLYELFEKAQTIHNKYRTKHNSPNLDLKLDLCEIAQKYAEKCAKTDTIEHCCDLYNGEVIGQNIEIIDYNNKFDIDKICKKWYNEKEKYDFISNKYKGDTRHFTQLIWRETKYIGFGLTNNNGKIYFVATYYPAGNIFSKFKENVKLKKV